MNQIIKTLVISSNWVTDLKEAYKNAIGGRLSSYETIIDRELKKEVDIINSKGYKVVFLSAAQITTGAVVYTIIAEKGDV